MARARDRHQDHFQARRKKPLFPPPCPLIAMCLPPRFGHHVTGVFIFAAHRRRPWGNAAELRARRRDGEPPYVAGTRKIDSTFRSLDAGVLSAHRTAGGQASPHRTILVSPFSKSWTNFGARASSRPSNSPIHPHVVLLFLSSRATHPRR
jgi:hypothetical protein